jgi:hypothetical protein
MCSRSPSDLDGGDLVAQRNASASPLAQRRRSPIGARMAIVMPRTARRS